MSIHPDQIASLGLLSTVEFAPASALAGQTQPSSAERVEVPVTSL